jgi:hypothetical protein
LPSRLLGKSTRRKIATGSAPLTLGRGLWDTTARLTSDRVSRGVSPFPSFLRQDRSHAGARLGRPVDPLKPRFGESMPCIVKVEQQFHIVFLTSGSNFWLLYYKNIYVVIA